MYILYVLFFFFFFFFFFSFFFFNIFIFYSVDIVDDNVNIVDEEPHFVGYSAINHYYYYYYYYCHTVTQRLDSELARILNLEFSSEKVWNFFCSNLDEKTVNV